MEINKKSRAELKAYFVKNALPTEGNFRDLIDAGLNQKDDGLVKAADQPAQIAASTAGDKPAIHLYESFATDTKPAWALSLQAGGKKGLGIGDGDGQNRLFIDATTGGVGIGTADPAGNKLRVAGNVLVDGAGGTAMLVIKDGNVGIGTADPAGNKLRVAGNILVDGTDGKARVSFGSTTRQMLNLWADGYGIGVQDGTTYFRTGSHFAFYKGGAHSDTTLAPGTGGAAMLVIKDGDVGIGTADPGGYKLNVTGNVKVGGAITPSVGNSASNGIMFPADPGGGTGDAAWIRYMVVSGESTKLQIGTSNDPDDTVSIWQYGAERLLVSSGIVYVSNIQLFSDRLLKHDIAPLGPVLGRVLRLQGVQYRWVDEKMGAGPQIGLIAQDVEAVFPELVSETHEGTKSVDYARLVAPLVEAVKELAAEVEALKLARAT
ncbi:tail fiber domain-containing protein [Sorangium atrum]|uniref:Tail fiber domain-containing protein n=1 Tax=Sorangium atrum TaxID=2995308 RepID=A0ABT5BQU5_9BACT|nr:tail fiber domain-containing protein [Sorangium aterium]MDC0676532.1 tail fiber domain-containing protein [Sorangium aterium]